MVAALVTGMVAGVVSAAGGQMRTSSQLVNAPGYQLQASARNPYMGSVEARPNSGGTMDITLNDAIRLGIENNLGLKLVEANQKTIHAERLQVINYLSPNISLHAETGVHQYDLAAQGFHPSSLAGFAKLAPPGTNFVLPSVTKADVTNAQFNLSQELFSWAGWDALFAVHDEIKAVNAQTASSAGDVILEVGNLYLQALAAGTRVEMAKSLLRSDKTALDHARDAHEAGTVAGISVLRAQVAYQSQQQVVLQVENAFEKAKIQLNRAIGLAPEQKIRLTEAAPYADLKVPTVEAAVQEAYTHRHDYRTLQAEIRAARMEKRAEAGLRFPSLVFHGNWGVTGVSGGLFHDTWAATGTLEIPIFDEAKFRGDHDVAQAQENELKSEFADLKQKIDQELRDSILDVRTATQLLAVARSNLDLANEELTETDERFSAGVDTNLPVVEAQATVAQAQAQYVQTELKYNEAKLALADRLGIIDVAFHPVLTPQVLKEFEN
ncbi:MAG: TolC family protein [Acidobacteriaceae bacterium]